MGNFLGFKTSLKRTASLPLEIEIGPQKELSFFQALIFRGLVSRRVKCPAKQKVGMDFEKPKGNCWWKISMGVWRPVG